MVKHRVGGRSHSSQIGHALSAAKPDASASIFQYESYLLRQLLPSRSHKLLYRSSWKGIGAAKVSKSVSSWLLLITLSQSEWKEVRSSSKLLSGMSQRRTGMAVSRLDMSINPGILPLTPSWLMKLGDLMNPSPLITNASFPILLKLHIMPNFSAITILELR